MLKRTLHIKNGHLNHQENSKPNTLKDFRTLVHLLTMNVHASMPFSLHSMYFEHQNLTVRQT